MTASAASSAADDDAADALLPLAGVETTCALAFHGAAGNSRPHSLLWVRAPLIGVADADADADADAHADADADADADASADGGGDHGAPARGENHRPPPLPLADTVIYASSGVVNLATSYSCLSNDVASVDRTLVTRTSDHHHASSSDGDGGGAEKKGVRGGRAILARGEAAEDAAAPRSITALAWVGGDDDDDDGCGGGEGGAPPGPSSSFGIVAAFSDGTVTSWRHRGDDGDDGGQRDEWMEHVLIGNDPAEEDEAKIKCARRLDDGADPSDLRESVADVTAADLDDGGATWLVATASSRGIFLHASHVSREEGGGEASAAATMVRSRKIGHHAAASVRLQRMRRNNKNGEGGNKGGGGVGGECYLFAGSASPRHNRVWVYTIPYRSIVDDENEMKMAADAASTWVTFPRSLLSIGEPHLHGHLLGHQDWITCFSWLDRFDDDGGEGRRRGDGEDGRKEESLLASSGHDAKIRLWKFSSRFVSAAVVPEPEKEEGDDDDDDGDDVVDSDEDEAVVDDLEEEEGEARLVVDRAVVVPSSLGGGESTTTTIITAISLEALLLGHEEAVTSLAWRPRRRRPNGAGAGERPCLLSSSMDRTILLWMTDVEEGGENGGTAGGAWSPIARVGSAGGILGGPVGASLMGFVDASFSPGDASRIVGHGYGGSIHFWTRADDEHDRDDAGAGADDEGGRGVGDDGGAATLEAARWIADPCITGHFEPVEDLAWDPDDGDYLLTTGLDQTVRLWAEVPVAASPNDAAARGGRRRHRHLWIEAGRPQVHGYDMTSIVCIGGEGGGDNGDAATAGGGEPCHRFASGADEKVLRVFDAPASTLRLLQQLRRSSRDDDDSALGPKDEPSSWRVERAFLPSLGLSNKATADADQESSKFSGPVNDDDLARTLDAAEGEGKVKLPSERDLGVTTPWPEARKLFGHGSEIVCLDACRARPSDGGVEGGGGVTLVASSSKARNDVASAAIRLWDANGGKCVGILKGGHRSTVSTMSFSRDGKYLASSGKDRRICIWKRIDGPAGAAAPSDGPGYELCAAADSAHKRIVWSIHFCPRRPDILASGSRDGLVKLWRISEAADGPLDIKELLRFEPSSKVGKNPVTAVAFAEQILEGGSGELDRGILGIGAEGGSIEVWAVPMTPNVASSSDNGFQPGPTLLCAVPPNNCHFDTVKRISWRPAANYTSGPKDSIDLTLASCGQDNGVRIFEVSIRNNAVDK